MAHCKANYLCYYVIAIILCASGIQGKRNHGHSSSTVHNNLRPQIVNQQTDQPFYSPPTALEYEPEPGYLDFPIYEIRHDRRDYLEYPMQNDDSLKHGFLIGRANNEFGYAHHKVHYTFYKVYNYYENLNKMPSEFYLKAYNITKCESSDSNSLCSPNSKLMCVKVGYMMCVTNWALTFACDSTNSLPCVYTEITTKPQSKYRFYVPCITKLTIGNPPVDGKNSSDVELCVTAIAGNVDHIPDNVAASHSMRHDLNMMSSATTLSLPYSLTFAIMLIGFKNVLMY